MVLIFIDIIIEILTICDSFTLLQHFEPKCNSSKVLFIYRNEK